MGRYDHDLLNILTAARLAREEDRAMRVAETHLHVLAEAYDLGGVVADNTLTNATGDPLLQLAVDFGPDADLSVQAATPGWFLLSVYVPHLPGCRLLLQGYVAGHASDVLTRRLTAHAL